MARDAGRGVEEGMRANQEREKLNGGRGGKGGVGEWGGGEGGVVKRICKKSRMKKW